MLLRNYSEDWGESARWSHISSQKTLEKGLFSTAIEELLGRAIISEMQANSEEYEKRKEVANAIFESMIEELHRVNPRRAFQHETFNNPEDKVEDAVNKIIDWFGWFHFMGYEKPELLYDFTTQKIPEWVLNTLFDDLLYYFTVSQLEPTDIYRRLMEMIKSRLEEWYIIRVWDKPITFQLRWNQLFIVNHTKRFEKLWITSIYTNWWTPEELITRIKEDRGARFSILAKTSERYKRAMVRTTWSI